MAEKMANVATMEPAEYVEVRLAQLSDEAKQTLCFNDPANRAQIAHMFSVEYIRLRHAMLEQNCLQFYRRYTGAMNALENAVGTVDAARLFGEAMKEVPLDVGGIPQL